MDPGDCVGMLHRLVLYLFDFRGSKNSNSGSGSEGQGLSRGVGTTSYHEAVWLR